MSDHQPDANNDMMRELTRALFAPTGTDDLDHDTPSLTAGNTARLEGTGGEHPRTGGGDVRAFVRHLFGRDDDQ
jgi:hypothetical protein